MGYPSKSKIDWTCPACGRHMTVSGTQLNSGKKRCTTQCPGRPPSGVKYPMMTDMWKQLPEDVRKMVEEADLLRNEAMGAVQQALFNTNAHDRAGYVARANKLVNEASYKWCVAMYLAERALVRMPTGPIRVFRDPQTGEFRVLEAEPEP